MNFWSLEAAPTPDEPLVVPPGATVNVNVFFIPDGPNPLSDDGNLILDEGTLVIANNSTEPFKEVELSGAGVQ